MARCVQLILAAHTHGCRARADPPPRISPAPPTADSLAAGVRPHRLRLEPPGRRARPAQVRRQGRDRGVRPDPPARVRPSRRSRAHSLDSCSSGLRSGTARSGTADLCFSRAGPSRARSRPTSTWATSTWPRSAPSRSPPSSPSPRPRPASRPSRSAHASTSTTSSAQQSSSSSRKPGVRRVAHPLEPLRTSR